MKTVELNENSQVREVLPSADSEEVVIMQNGQPIALVVPFDNDDLEWYARERDPAFIASIVRARKQVAGGQAVSHDQMKRELGMS
jgi:antitoxin (DNA-binding transcriptional repressor) of toxin-antitoxin stability system